MYKDPLGRSVPADPSPLAAASGYQLLTARDEQPGQPADQQPDEEPGDDEGSCDGHDLS